MKLFYSRLLVLAVLFSVLIVSQSCEKPFDDVVPILTNIAPAYEVKIQVLDANPNATNPFPDKPVVTLAGAAVDTGVIFNAGGTVVTSASGSAIVTSNTINLVVKAGTVISEAAPLKFIIKAEANNYLSNTKEITITSLDDIQYINMGLLRLSNLPAGVSTQNVSKIATAGSIGTNATVNVGTSNAVSATFPGNTVFLDATNTPITSAGNFSVTATSFSAATPASIAAVPGGVSGTTDTNQNVSFVVAGAVEINATIGGKAIKSFSSPIPFVVNLSTGVFNPTTNAALKIGDQLTVWSKNAGSTIWKNESVAAVVSDGNGGLRATMQVSHLSTWMLAFGIVDCTSKTSINYSSSSTGEEPFFIEARVNGGNNQLLYSGGRILKNGDKFELRLPQNVSVTFNLYASASASGTPITTSTIPACATSVTLTNNVVSTNPLLSFDLQTKCTNGIARYNGNISYKLSTEKVYGPFTPSIDGKLTTNLLAWDQRYDFKVSYKGVDYVRSRTVTRGEFRQNGATWNFFGTGSTQQAFFNAPTACN